MTTDEVHLFINKEKLNNEILNHLTNIIIHKYDEAAEWIGKWLQSHIGEHKVSVIQFVSFIRNALKRRVKLVKLSLENYLLKRVLPVELAYICFRIVLNFHSEN